jgi:hypothetical protein
MSLISDRPDHSVMAKFTDGDSAIITPEEYDQEESDGTIETDTDKLPKGTNLFTLDNLYPDDDFDN